MADADKIEKIAAVGSKESKVDKLSKEGFQKTQPVEGKFEAVMDKKVSDEDVSKNVPPQTKKPNVEDIAKNIQSRPIDPSQTSKELVAQTKEASQRIDAIKSELETPNLTIRKPENRLMTNRLTHISENLKIALTKAGAQEAEVPTEAKPGTVVNPALKFLDSLTHSQSQLDHLGAYLEALNSTGKQLTPANMLAIQIKVNHVQQELEFFTNMLNQALQSTKSLMNVQV